MLTRDIHTSLLDQLDGVQNSTTIGTYLGKFHHDLFPPVGHHPKCGLVTESPKNTLNSGLGIIVICPDLCWTQKSVGRGFNCLVKHFGLFVFGYIFSSALICFIPKSCATTLQWILAGMSLTYTCMKVDDSRSAPADP